MHLRNLMKALCTKIYQEKTTTFKVNNLFDLPKER